jgi:hypothetical protein
VIDVDGNSVLYLLETWTDRAVDHDVAAVEADTLPMLSTRHAARSWTWEVACVDLLAEFNWAFGIRAT